VVPGVIVKFPFPEDKFFCLPILFRLYISKQTVAKTGGRGPQAYYSTKTDDTGKDVLTRYAMRWSLGETNQNSKGHLGFAEPQGWTRRAVERGAPTAMLLYSLILLWFAKVGHRHYRPLHAPWCPSKAHAAFGDMLTTLRRESIREQVSVMAPSGRGCRKLIHVLLHAVQQAA
jgi:hypothetical protein